MEHTYELRHHGVKGQTWGNRQYQNMDGSLTALGREHYGYGSARNDRKVARYEAKSKKYSTLADQSSSNFKKRYNIKKAANAEAKAEIVKQYNAKRKQGKIKSDTFGYKRSSIRNEVYSKAAKKIAEEATKEGSRSQRQWKAAAYNYKQFSNYDKKMAAKSKGKQFVESQILRTNLMGVSIQRTSGRKTTVGKEFVDRFFTGGTVGAVKDLEYKIDHRQPKDKSSSGSKPKERK